MSQKMNKLRKNPIYAVALSLLIVPALSVSAQDQAQIEADSLTFNQDQNSVAAQGNVNILYQGKSLTADDVTWDQGKDIIKADGNINLIDPDGTRTRAAHMELRDKMQNGNMERISVDLPDNARFQSPSATLQNGTLLTMSSPTYTACEPCENPEDAPFWQIRSRESVQNKTTQTVSYWHNTLDIYGLPIIYTPYFSHPTSDVKKRSGFLAPSIGSDGKLGANITTPYFIDLAPNYDITLRPQITTDEGIVLSADWRHLTKAGQYEMTLIGTEPQDELATVDGDHPFRGGILAKGELSVSDWILDFDIVEPSDDTFFDRYNISDETTLTSNAKLMRSFGQDNVSIEMVNYRYVTGGNGSTNIQHILPSVQHTRRFANPFLGGKMTLANSAIHSVRNYGYDLTELRSRLDWYASTIDRHGLVWRVDNRLQWDGFYYNQGKHQATFQTAANDETYIANSIALNVEYPLVRFGPMATQNLKPRVQIIGAMGDNDYFTQYLRSGVAQDISPSALFRMDAPGQETSRANYGVEYSIETNSDLRAKFFVGQSYNLDKYTLASKTGYGDDESNIVSNANLSFGQFSVNTEFRLDQVDRSVLRNQTSVAYANDRFSADARYSFYETGQIGDRLEDAAYGARYRFAQNWSVRGQRQENLRTGVAVNDSLSLLYEDDCTMLEIRYTKDNTQVGNVEPSSSINIYFALRTLSELNN